MSEFVRKSAIGYKTVPGGHNDPDLTHIILTKAEYNELMNQIQMAKKEAAAAAFQAEQKVKAISSQANTNLQKIQAAADKAVADLQADLAEEQEERRYQENLNANLLRISKERANASRKLKPKKEHSGYVVISSTEKDHIYKYGANRKTVRLWETILQTPFPIDFTEEQARKEMEELFIENELGDWPIGKIGITGLCLDGYGGLMRSNDAAEWMKLNVMVERKLRANFRAGFWELVFLHTKPLGIVPVEMRPG